MKSAIRFGLVMLILLLGAGGLWFYWSRTAPRAGASTGGVFTQVVEVRRGSLSASISVVGELEAVQKADLTFDRMSGVAELVELNVQAGNPVQAGQVLATIDPAPYQQALDQARSELQAAEETLADLQAPPTELEIAQADLAVAKAELQLQQAQDALDDLIHPDIAALQSDVAEAEATLAKAQAYLVALQSSDAYQLELQKKLDAEAEVAAEYNRLASETYSDPWYQDRLQLAYNKMMDAQDPRISLEIQRQIDILKAQMEVRKAQAALEDAQEALAEAQAGGDKLKLAQAQVAVREAEVALAQAREERAKLDEGPDAVTLAQAQADVDKKRLAVNEAEAALVGTELIAPFDGTVLQTYAKPGDLITADTPILTVANLKALQVVASVDETLIRRVAVGQQAQITFDAFPGQTFRGEVLSVPLQGTLQGDVMVYEVPVSLEGAEGLPLLVGMTANVKIQVGQVEDALLVPTMALQRVGGLYQVLVPNGVDPAGEPEAVPVEVGLSDGVYTQIVRGLNPGDKVVVQIEASQSNPFFRGLGGMMIMGGGPPRSSSANR